MDDAFARPRDAPLRQLEDGTVVVESADAIPLDPSRPEPDRRRADALVLDGRSVLDLRSEETLVRCERRLEILDRDT